MGEENIHPSSAPSQLPISFQKCYSLTIKTESPVASLLPTNNLINIRWRNTLVTAVTMRKLFLHLLGTIMLLNIGMNKEGKKKQKNRSNLEGDQTYHKLSRH